MICAKWSGGEGRAAPKKIYEATQTGILENERRQTVWQTFQHTVNSFLKGETET